MTSLNPDDKYFIVINTFSVDPADADLLLRGLIEITKEDVGKRAGFVSANFHVTADRTAVINYAQWRSKDDSDAMLQDPKNQVRMRQATVLATKIKPVFVDLVWTSAILD